MSNEIPSYLLFGSEPDPPEPSPEELEATYETSPLWQALEHVWPR